jgi:hypothetical protein
MMAGLPNMAIPSRICTMRGVSTYAARPSADTSWRGMDQRAAAHETEAGLGRFAGRRCCVSPLWYGMASSPTSNTNRRHARDCQSGGGSAFMIECSGTRGPIESPPKCLGYVDSHHRKHSGRLSGARGTVKAVI